MMINPKYSLYWWYFPAVLLLISYRLIGISKD